MRVHLHTNGRKNLFDELERKNLTVKNLAQQLGVSSRTVRDWRNGKHTIPMNSYNQLTYRSGLKAVDLCPILIDDKEQKRKAGQLGATSQWALYGPLGTKASRTKGGQASYELRKNIKGDIFTTNQIIKAVSSTKLAEFIGIMIGDGGMTQYQVAIALNMTDDKEYVKYVARLIYNLFAIQPTIKHRTAQNCTVLTVSSVRLVKYLKTKGVVVGDKIKQGLDIPEWIMKRKIYSLACLRGTFDTDGCIFQEKHKIKGKQYSYLRWSLVSASPKLLKSIAYILNREDYTPVTRYRRVNLERFADIEQYFKIVGSNNPKHTKRFELFGGVG